MDKIKKNFGFGCMRLPMKDGEVDIPETKKMVDAFLDAGFNYFDTAHGYIQGRSEKALKECLTSRYPRDRYILTDKLTGNFFKTEADIRPFFESQLEACGVEYFDFYLMHVQGAGNYAHYKECHAYENAFALKAEGKIRHVVSFMADFQPLNEKELEAVRRVQEIFRSKHLIPCTSCRYCTDGCPKHISIPDLFAVMNTKQLYHDWNADYYYNVVHTAPGRKASDCLKCGKCEKVCPQHLPIRKLLEDVAAEFEKA